MKYPVLALVLGLMSCSDAEVMEFLSSPQARNIKQVEVLGRIWTVAPDPNNPGYFTAQRDNNDLDPYGRPAVLRTIQATRAIEQATGCRVLRNTMVQDTSARFVASVTCPS